MGVDGVERLGADHVPVTVVSAQPETARNSRDASVKVRGILNEAQATWGGRICHCNFCNTIVVLCPPNPKELFSTTLSFFSRA